MIDSIIVGSTFTGTFQQVFQHNSLSLIKLIGFLKKKMLLFASKFNNYLALMHNTQTPLQKTYFFPYYDTERLVLYKYRKGNTEFNSSFRGLLGSAHPIKKEQRKEHLDFFSFRSLACRTNPGSQPKVQAISLSPNFFAIAAAIGESIEKKSS